MMFKKMLFAAAAAILLVVASLAFFPGHAFAAAGKGGAGADKEMATKQGLPTKEFDKDKLPTKLDLGFTAGSVIAVIAAVKYL